MEFSQEKMSAHPSIPPDSYLKYTQSMVFPVVMHGCESESEKSLSRVQLIAPPWIIQSMEFSRLEYWSRWPFPSLGDLPNAEIESRSPSLWADSLPAEPPGKPKNKRVGSLSLLQQIFPTQESNQDLLHCSWILYQLSYQGS